MIGEDGRMTAEAGERFEGMTAAEAPRPWSRRCASRASLRGERALRALGAVLGALRRADRAADLAAVVLPHGRAGGAGDRSGRERRGADRPRATTSACTSTGCARSGPGASRASCGGATRSRSGTGPRARRSSPSPRSSRARRRERGLDPGVAEPRDRRPRHLVQLGAVAVRNPRLARRNAAFAGLLSDQLPDHGARDHLPLGRADGDDGDRVRRRHPVPRRLRAPGRPGARRAADVEVAGNRDRPARGDRGPRRRRAALRRARDLLDPGRALLARADPAGTRPGEQDVERVAAGPAERGRGRAGAADRAGSRTAGS